jgi:hypothetical protein
VDVAVSSTDLHLAEEVFPLNKFKSAVLNFFVCCIPARNGAILSRLRHPEEDIRLLDKARELIRVPETTLAIDSILNHPEREGKNK